MACGYSCSTSRSQDTDFLGRHPAAHLFAVVRDLEFFDVQRPSAVLVDRSINSRINLPPFHAAFDASIPRTMGHDKLRRDTQALLGINLYWCRSGSMQHPM